MKAEDFDKKFDDGKEDIIDDLDLSSMQHANQLSKSSWSNASRQRPWIAGNRILKMGLRITT